MKKIRIISLLMAVLMILPFAAACKTTEGDGTGTGTGTSTATGSNKPANDDGTLNYINVEGLTYGKDGDYISLYDIGINIFQISFLFFLIHRDRKSVV